MNSKARLRKERKIKAKSKLNQRVAVHNEGVRHQCKYKKLVRRDKLPTRPQGFRVRHPQDRGSEDRTLGILSRLYNYEGQPDAYHMNKTGAKFVKASLTSGKKVWRQGK